VLPGHVGTQKGHDEGLQGSYRQDTDPNMNSIRIENGFSKSLGFSAGRLWGVCDADICGEASWSRYMGGLWSQCGAQIADMPG